MQGGTPTEWTVPLAAGDKDASIAFIPPEVADDVTPVHPWLPMPAEVNDAVRIASNRQEVARRFVERNTAWIVQHAELLWFAGVSEGEVVFRPEQPVQMQDLRQNVTFVADLAKRVDAAMKAS